MNLRQNRRRITTASWAILAVAPWLGPGCSSAQSKPLYTPAEQRELFSEEASGDLQRLIELEASYGSGHSQVRQMKLELGLDPDRSAAAQSP